MDTLNEYRARVRELLQQYVKERTTSGEAETQLITDTEHDHYQVVYVGWDNDRRVYGCVLHIDIKGDKIWIQHNSTEHRVAEELTAMGVPKHHIVLGFQPAYKRPFTDFAVG